MEPVATDESPGSSRATAFITRDLIFFPRGLRGYHGFVCGAGCDISADGWPQWPPAFAGKRFGIRPRSAQDEWRPLMLELYFWPTGNGKKTIICLEEMGLDYKIHPVNIMRGDQFDPDYLKIAPNNRMPALIDSEPEGGGAPVSIFESGAILMYLAEKTGRFWPQELHKKYDVVQWVMWQMANQGPKMGEQGHFRRASANPDNGDLNYAITRFDDETHRIYGVMNLGLHGKQYLAAGEYTIADMICYPWVSNPELRNIDIAEFPNVKRWLAEMGARPAVQKAMAMGPEFREDPATISDEEKARRAKILANQRAQPIPKEWLAAD
jgi:GST-like protein